MRPGTLLRWQALKKILKSEIQDGSEALDLGGYDGYISYNLKEILPHLKVRVVDIDKSGLQQARKHGLNTINASALNLPIKDNQIDVILCLQLIEHVKEDDKLVKEVSRVLKKGGKLIFATPGERGISFPFLSKEKIEIINKSWGHVRKGYSIENIKRLFKEANLVIEKTDRYFNFFSRFVYRISILSNIFSKIPFGRKVITILYKIILKLEPYIKYGAQSYIIVAKKGNHKNHLKLEL